MISHYYCFWYSSSTITQMNHNQYAPPFKQDLQCGANYWSQSVKYDTLTSCQTAHYFIKSSHQLFPNTYGETDGYKDKTNGKLRGVFTPFVTVDTHAAAKNEINPLFTYTRSTATQMGCNLKRKHNLMLATNVKMRALM